MACPWIKGLLLLTALSSQDFISASERFPQTFHTAGGIGANKLILLRHHVRWDLELSHTSTVRGGRSGMAGPLPDASRDANSDSI
jgi:hypothetical protein